MAGDMAIDFPASADEKEMKKLMMDNDVTQYVIMHRVDPDADFEAKNPTGGIEIDPEDVAGMDQEMKDMMSEAERFWIMRSSMLVVRRKIKK